MNERKTFDQIYDGINFNENPFGVGWNIFHKDRDEVYQLILKNLNEGLTLDDGGGFGYLGQFIPRNQYFNLDISRNIIGYDNSWHRVIATGTCIPYRNQVFDNVVSYGVVRYMQKWIHYFREAHRVLKRKGRFIVSTIRKKWQIDTIKRPIFWISTLKHRRNLETLNHLRNLQTLKFPEKTTILDRKKRPHVLYDKYWSEHELSEVLEETGFRMIFRTRVGYYLEGIKLVSNHGYDPRKHGYFLFSVCEKR